MFTKGGASVSFGEDYFQVPTFTLNTNKDIGVSENLTKNAIWQINYTFIGLGKMSLDLAEDWRVIRASSRVTECAGGEIINSQYLNILYFPVDTVILSHRLIPGKNILDTLYRLWTNWRPVSRSSDHYQPISIWSWTLYIDSAASAATCDCSNCSRECSIGACRSNTSIFRR